MTHPSLAHPLRGRTALVTGVSDRRGIGDAAAVEDLVDRA
jgi:NAD(P)-dependent dehydrogenase (short-subunit alcohol dehydrogenase family)